MKDDDIIVINKPRDLVVHPGAGNPDGTVLMRCFITIRPLPMYRVRASSIVWIKTPPA
ncbi:23S rRNA pseudouridine synthase [Escherichia coli]|uniref:23S rRNA pseudouridine synthase n=1 Tax=Escherichia coli TaxID=562 RepID=A0A377D026_ECOLX|nr:23S rRNA pseudouridine synthase [Escherichia coli]